MTFQETHDLIILSEFGNNKILNYLELKSKVKETIGDGIIDVQVDMKNRGLIDTYMTVDGISKIEITQLGINKYKSILEIKKQERLKKIILYTTFFASILSAIYSIAQYYKQSDTVQTIEQKQLPTKLIQQIQQKNIQILPNSKAVKKDYDSSNILKYDSSFKK